MQRAKVQSLQYAILLIKSMFQSWIKGMREKMTGGQNKPKDQIGGKEIPLRYKEDGEGEEDLCDDNRGHDPVLLDMVKTAFMIIPKQKKGDYVNYEFDENTRNDDDSSGLYASNLDVVSIHFIGQLCDK